jgi:hypothetical protein
MMWLHFPFFGRMMTRRSLNLVGETSSLDPNDLKPMTKRGQITTKNTLTNLTASPAMPLGKGNRKVHAARQTASLGCVFEWSSTVSHMQHADLRGERQHKHSTKAAKHRRPSCLWNERTRGRVHRHESSHIHRQARSCKNLGEIIRSEKQKSTSTNIDNRSVCCCA